MCVCVWWSGEQLNLVWRKRRKKSYVQGLPKYSLYKNNLLQKLRSDVFKLQYTGIKHSLALVEWRIYQAAFEKKSPFVELVRVSGTMFISIIMRLDKGVGLGFCPSRQTIQSLCDKL